jgi:putative SOS response-associated peptidase YedK
MALAGLWERGGRGGREALSFAIIAKRSNELCAELHDRMPVIIGPRKLPAWLGEKAADPVPPKAMLAPYRSDEMTYWLVSTRVGNVKNNDPNLNQPIATVDRDQSALSVDRAAVSG